jgi:hypothetical protein
LNGIYTTKKLCYHKPQRSPGGGKKRTGVHVSAEIIEFFVH